MSRIKASFFKKYLPISILLMGLLSFFALGGEEYLSLSALQAHRAFLVQWTEVHYFLAVLVFMLTYILAVSFSLPGASILTITGGFLFGVYWGTFYVVLSATAGAVVLFLAARSAFGDILKRKAGGLIKNMERGFQKNAWSYLMTVRLIPIFPFWVVNIAAAMLNIRFSIYVVATFLGIIPGTAVYALVGDGIGGALEMEPSSTVQILYEPKVLFALGGLALLSLLPIAYNYLKGRRG